MFYAVALWGWSLRFSICLSAMLYSTLNRMTILTAVTICRISALWVSGTSLKKSPKTYMATTSPAVLTASIVPRSALNGIHSLKISINPISDVVYSAIVEISDCEIPSVVLSSVIKMMFSAIQIDAGAARVIILKVKLPRTMFLFGCSARTKDGNPTVSAPISESWIGSKG